MSATFPLPAKVVILSKKEMRFVSYDLFLKKLC